MRLSTLPFFLFLSLSLAFFSCRLSHSAVYFVLLVFFSAFFIVNLFLAVISQMFYDEHLQQDQISRLRKWVRLCLPHIALSLSRLLARAPPPTLCPLTNLSLFLCPRATCAARETVCCCLG